VARAATRREKIIKFEGCYHGHADAFLVQAGSGALTLGVPTSPGVTRGAAGDTLIASYNDASSVERLFDANRGEIAAVIVEPVAGNMGLVPPAAGFLDALRQLCTAHGAALIFDEVISGFRAGAGGAQGHFRIEPDLTCLGKIIGGGLPVGAYGGRADLMELVSPAGPVYQAGTLSGNPVAVAAGLATLKAVASVQAKVEATTRALVDGLTAEAIRAGVTFSAQSIGSMFGLYFRAQPPATFAEVMQCDREAFNRFFHAMLERGVYLAPSAYEAGFVSAAHGAAEIEATLAAAREAFRRGKA
jgi:glutamate-1-semialdehyde 2,1-aminomutase